MPDYSSAASQISSRSRLSRNGALLVSVSAAALLMSAPVIHARSMNGSGGGGAISAPNIASDAAAQAAQQAASAARQTQDSLARAARAVQDMQGVQAAARAAAAARQTSMTVPVVVPNGIGTGGLLPGAPASWNGANRPTQNVDAGGQTQVNIRQTTQQAILNWQSFNVGARTTLTFDQQGQANWVALNRVDNATAPSQIIGNIRADGHVYVINRSGIIFGGNAQVNVGSLIASTADIADSQFRANGIYSTQTGNIYAPSFTAAGGKVVVEAGASITTRAPTSVTSGGGYVLMIGSQVENAGSIATPKGQTLLAAGDSFILRRGFGTEGNATSTTRGIEISTTITGNSGVVSNSGLIFAQQGDITLAGRTLNQGGVVLSTSSVNTRGTIHLANSAADKQGSVTLAAGSVTAILPELESSETALDSQRDALIKSSDAANVLRAASAIGAFDNLSVLADRQDQSRIEIVTGGTVNFQNQSHTMAQGGHIAVSVGTRVFVESGSRLDVSGTRDVLLPMSANQILVNVQGNELRDSPINRDSGALINKNVWIDIRDLVLMPAGTGGYASDRYYTKGGLLELGGYLSNTAHKIGEWSAVGGTITLAAPEVIAQQGATFDISGGSVSYEGGRIYSTKLIGSDGRIYSFDNAPADMKFIGAAGGFARTHNIQGKLSDQLTEIWSTVFDRSSSWRYEAGYTVGRDAGRLNLSTPTALFAADIVADVVTGERQNSARATAFADGYKQGQNATPLAGTLAVGQYTALGRTNLYKSDVQIGVVADVTANLNAQDLLPADRANTVWLDAGRLSRQGLGRIEIGTRGAIDITSDLTLANGGALDLTAAVIDIKADVTAHGGSINPTNVFSTTALGVVPLVDAQGMSKVVVRAGVVLDVSGLRGDASDESGLNRLAYLNGGSVSLQSTRHVAIEDGSLIDVSSGAALLRSGKIQGGRGGNVTLTANLNSVDTTGELTLAGEVRGYGLTGGGTLALQAGRVTIGAAPNVVEPGTLALAADFFSKGFGAYTITGNRGVTVADGATVDVTMPIYRPASGSDLTAGLEVWTPLLFVENARTGVLTQRGGASLSLQAGSNLALASDLSSLSLVVGKNATINVDPGKSIALVSAGQLTVDGTLHAAGGSITLKNIALAGIEAERATGTVNSRSIWIGEGARLDVAAQAVTARDVRGRRYGLVGNGGSIVIGGEIDAGLGQATSAENFIIIRPGAVLDASGAVATLDIPELGAVNLASNGGSISLISNNGLYLDGTMIARAGGAGAAGGRLNVALQMLEYRIQDEGADYPIADPRVRAPREIVIADKQGGTVLAGNLRAGAADPALVYGYGRLGADTVTNGGFDNLAVMSTAIAFDGPLNLRTAQSIDLYSSGLVLGANAPLDSRVAVSSAYVRLGQENYASTSQNPAIGRTSVGGASRPAPVGAHLDVSAQLIDIRDTVSLGAGETTLRSAGDIRFVQGVSPNASVISTTLISPVGVTLQAAQIYPATGVRAQINVGERLSDDGTLEYDPAQVLRILSNGAGVPQVPYSAFGDLTLKAGTIEQGGVLRAPLGRLELGNAGSTVILLPGSVTSVSGAGLQMPYGGTVDGLTYNYDGKAVSLTGVGAGGGSFGSTLLIGLTLTGAKIDVRQDAVLDMSGGGELLGAGFVSGRGGSTDARYASLMQVVGGKITQPGLTTNPVYAIVPGAQHAYAPAGGERSALDPVVGQQITLRESIPGLPAGTYTLMPASYALLPGAFRVELNGTSAQGAAIASLALANGSFAASAQLGIVNTGIADRLSRQVILTSRTVMRNYAKYDETSYADFVRADALRIGVPRAMIEADAKSLLLNLQAGNGADAFRFRGEGRFAVANGGFGGSLTATTGDYYSEAGDIEIVAAGAQATAGFAGVTLDGGALSAVGASRLVIGGTQYVDYGKTGTVVGTGLGARDLVLRSGAVLSGPEVFLSAAGNLSIEQGAGIITLGRGQAAYDAADGFHYSIGRSDQAVSMVAVSNGVLSMLPPVGETPSGNLQIGGCLTVCAGETQLYSEGTVVLSTSGQFTLDDAVRYGTRNLTLAVQGINVGDSAALAAAAAGNVLPAGLTLNQSVLDRLLRGDTQHGAPALQALTLSATNSVNFYGSATLDTIDPVTGKSTLDTLVLGTPAIYGSGNAGDVATIRTGNLIWKGATTAPGTVVTGGAGTGSGTLNIEAARIEFGYGPGSQPTGASDDARLALGFANVNLRASDRITANQKGSFSVYQSQGAYQPGTGYAYSGGNLTITAPLVTGEAGSVNRITAGGALVLTAPASGATAPTADAVLGAELSLAGRDVIVDTLLAMPSGKLTLTAERDLTLTDRATIDMAGRTVAFNDVKKYSWGGDVVLDSRNGSIRQAAGSVIDLSAQNNRGGSLKATALADLAGVVDLQGSILGSTSGVYDAGGTLVPYKAAAVEIRAQRLGDTGTLDAQFAALNQRLNAGGVFGARRFQFKQGDLTVGSDVKAGQVDISIDNGSLTVIGAIDASGAQVGSIVLAARNNLTIAGGALLDAHGAILRVDSYGKIIDAPNRAIVDLTSRDGTLTLASGARIDLRHGADATVGSAAYQNDGQARGTLELNAGRTGEISGDVRIDASGAVDIRGARSIAVNATWRYDDATYGTDPAAGGRPYQEITQDYLDIKHGQSVLFMDAALANGVLMNGKLAGLRSYTNAFHLRPGVEIVSATPDGDLVVKGDLDLSKYRYDSVNPNTQKTGIYGSGEPGALTIRAGGNLDIYGSITDGFAPPPATQDDNGWLLLPGINLNGGDIVVPRGGVVIADGTAYEGGTTLNYDLPIKAMKFDANIVIPAPSALAAPLTVPAGTVLSATVRDASGNVLYAAGTILGASVTLPAETRFDAGMRLPGTAELAALVWPQGVPLPLQIGNPTGGTSAIRLYVLNGNTTLPQGALLPAATNIKLADGATSIDLRPSVNTRQGSLWALAKMLPEGSQSWSVRLVAGADTEAADSRTVQANPKRGDIRLADHHYGMFGKTVPGAAVFTWTQAAVDELGGSFPEIVLGSVISDEFLGSVQPGLTASAYCADSPAHCQKASYTWTQDAVDELGGSFPEIVLGGVITDTFLGSVQPGLTAFTYCNDTPLHCGKLAPDTVVPTAGSSRFSVIRTGAADLELLAGGNLRMDTLFGVYTAGASSAATYAGDPYNLPRALGADGKVLVDKDGAYEKFVDGVSPESTARAWYPTGGGNLTLKAGGDLTGDLMLDSGYSTIRPNPKDTGYNTAAIGNWLWRQGSGSTLGQGADQATAWFINFGTYVPGAGADQMVGFTGFGTLGGGNLHVDVGGNAGILAQRGSIYTPFGIDPRSQGLVLAVGSTGRVLADGSLSLTGGGDIDMRIGGTLNAFTLNAAQNQDNADKNALLNGALVNLRGNVSLQAGGLGVLPLDYLQASLRDTRAADPFTASKAFAQIGLVLAPGDASYNIATRGDLVIKGVNDPGRVTLANQPGFTLGGASGRGDSWFSLWTAHSAINLFSAGGDLTPITVGAGITSTDLAYVYPSILTAVAASGSLYYGAAADYNRISIDTGDLLLAPSANSRLEFLAKGSIYAEGFAVSQSGAASAAMATPFRPGFAVTERGLVTRTNVSADANPAAGLPLFAFGPDSASAEWAGVTDPARFYAVTGDLVGVSSGRLITFDGSDTARAGQKRYQGGPTRMMAGRDIVSSGTPIGQDEQTSYPIGYASADNLFVNRTAADVSLVSAGRDILYSSFSVAGPGTLQVSAGRNILMADKGRVSSVGPAIAGDTRLGAGITMLAGIGANPPDYPALLSYLDPANLAPTGMPLEASGKVAKTYEKELVAWLRQRIGFAGSDAEARATFDALAPEQQQIFLRQVYFAELTAGGREYNDTTSSRYGSYLRGRAAIAALFPDATAMSGDIIMFGGSGVQTLFGGDIQMFTPSGKLTVGVEGVAPPATAGLVTQGSGNIQIYSQGSVLLGLSRIMTTFGGNIIAWTANGDINAGRGAKTTVVYTPPKRVYDIYGNVTLSPQAPSSGAGIATLNPIPEVKAGDIDLIAPLGTIDAGEAGIRVSGNINLAALQIVNAANISVQGSSSGIPTVQAPSISAALSNSNATTATQQTAAPTQSANGQPSVITVEVLGYGSGDITPDDDKQRRNRGGLQDPASRVQVIGSGELSQEQRQKLTPAEQRSFDAP